MDLFRAVHSTCIYIYIILLGEMQHVVNADYGRWKTKLSLRWLAHSSKHSAARRVLLSIESVIAGNLCTFHQCKNTLCLVVWVEQGIDHMWQKACPTWTNQLKQVLWVLMQMMSPGAQAAGQTQASLSLLGRASAGFFASKCINMPIIKCSRFPAN